ncbi:MAG: acyl-CoA thioesterase II [Alphaproteobacteria bacterium]|nr:acyl-CoA thioesterase II [Alphaproteobacteria bacterium]
MTEPLAVLVELLDLEPIEVNIFRGRSPEDRWPRVFGGQVIAQALVAATRTVEADRPAHSLHGYFIRPGDPKIPILYEVERIRDGASFTTRRVVAIQHGEAIFSMSASFQVVEEGFSHQDEIANVPSPDELPSEAELVGAMGDKLPEEVAALLKRKNAIEIRPVAPRDFWRREKMAPRGDVWLRMTGEVGEDPALNRALLAYASDLSLLDTSMRPHGVSFRTPNMQTASLDHALWFHRPFRMDDWLLYVQESPSASGARGFTRGQVFTREGVLVASVAQEGLIRRRPPKPKANAEAKAPKAG